MRIGLIDVDGHNFPSLPLMKISAYHKKQGDSVEWYYPLISGHMDRVYMSKVFSFSEDYPYCINADEIFKGGSGYCIEVEDGVEKYNKQNDANLPDEIEHIYPDYSLYGIEDTAYGFLTRGCPRGCDFCHVGCKEGLVSRKVADLNEFWNGQSKIVLLDPNLIACRECNDLLKQLADSKAKVELSQGIDVRMLTEEKIEKLNQIKLVKPHFAWDKYSEKEFIVPKLEMAANNMKVRTRDIMVYVLVNFDTTIEQDLERVMILRKLGYTPYIMRYKKETLCRGHILNALARWCNMPACFWKYDTFEDYLKENRKSE